MPWTPINGRTMQQSPEPSSPPMQNPSDDEGDDNICVQHQDLSSRPAGYPVLPHHEPDPNALKIYEDEDDDQDQDQEEEGEQQKTSSQASQAKASKASSSGTAHDSNKENCTPSHSPSAAPVTSPAIGMHPHNPSPRYAALQAKRAVFAAKRGEMGSQNLFTPPATTQPNRKRKIDDRAPSPSPPISPFDLPPTSPDTGEDDREIKRLRTNLSASSALIASTNSQLSIKTSELVVAKEAQVKLEEERDLVAAGFRVAKEKAEAAEAELEQVRRDAQSKTAWGQFWAAMVSGAVGVGVGVGAAAMAAVQGGML